MRRRVILGCSYFIFRFRTISDERAALLHFAAPRWQPPHLLDLPYAILIGPLVETPIRSIGASEILAACKAIRDGKILSHTMSKVLGVHITLNSIVDNKALLNSLSTGRNSIDKSIRVDVNCIRIAFERFNVDRIIWVPGKLNLDDPGTKLNSPLTTPLQLTMVYGRLANIFEAAELCDVLMGNGNTV